MSSQYITVRESAQILGVSEKKIMDLIEGRKLQAYRIADQFLRLKRVEVTAIRTTGEVVSDSAEIEYTPQEKLLDFLYFNDFYLVAGFVSLVLLYVIFFTD